MEKNNSGITLVSLAITIIVLSILASIGIYSGIQTVRSSKLTKFTTEMKIMQLKVNEWYEHYPETQETGKDLSTAPQDKLNQAVSGSGLNITTENGYRYYDTDTIKALQIDGVDGEFFISITNRSVVSVEGFQYEGQTYYTLEQLPDGLYNVEYTPGNYENPTFKISYEKIAEEKWRIIISDIVYEGYINKWIVKYQEEGKDYWNTTEDLSFVVEKASIYNIAIENGEIKSETKSILISEINEPKLAEGMVPIKWNNNNWEICSDNDLEWYSYMEQTQTTEDGGTSKWANAKVTIDGVESYFVWIPRYAYKIDSENQTIDVKFLKDAGVEAIDGTICKYADDSSLNTSTDYIIHPAFTTNADLGGGWSTELTGLWIGKYEAARNDSGISTLGESTKIKTQPNVISWTGTAIGEMYDYAKEYSINLKSHMLKNSEWGAAAYLTHSQYGRNGTEVTKNTNFSHITAGGDIEANTIQSSTGNVYGIYDLAGGAFEHVAAYYNGSTGLTNGNTFASQNGESNEYATVYEDTDIETAYKYGDATKETRGWNNDEAYFISSNSPFFMRGGYYDFYANAGVFTLYESTGGINNYCGFRICLVVQ